MSAQTKIEFYLVNGPYGEFSNFARFRIWLDNKNWPTAEHYFQAMKFLSIEDQEEIRRASTAKEAAEKGRDRKKKFRPNWDLVRDDFMREAVWAKFTQHDELRTLLMATGNALLVEHTEKDSYWGDGGDGTGENRLGKILMEVRKKINLEARK